MMTVGSSVNIQLYNEDGTFTGDIRTSTTVTGSTRMVRFSTSRY